MTRRSLLVHATFAMLLWSGMFVSVRFSPLQQEIGTLDNALANFLLPQGSGFGFSPVTVAVAVGFLVFVLPSAVQRRPPTIFGTLGVLAFLALVNWDSAGPGLLDSQGVPVHGGMEEAASSVFIITVLVGWRIFERLDDAWGVFQEKGMDRQAIRAVRVRDTAMTVGLMGGGMGASFALWSLMDRPPGFLGVLTDPLATAIPLAALAATVLIAVGVMAMVITGNREVPEGKTDTGSRE